MCVKPIVHKDTEKDERKWDTGRRQGGTAGCIVGESLANGDCVLAGFFGGHVFCVSVGDGVEDPWRGESLE